MKKTLFYLLIIIITLPSIINAEEKEVKYKWYQNVIDKVHYEIDPEQTCEYLEKVDYNDFIYSDVMYSLEKPEEKEGRVIKETAKTVIAVITFFFPEKQVILNRKRISSKIRQISRRIIRKFCIAMLHSTKLFICRLSF